MIKTKQDYIQPKVNKINNSKHILHTATKHLFFIVVPIVEGAGKAVRSLDTLWSKVPYLGT